MTYYKSRLTKAPVSSGCLAAERVARRRPMRFDRNVAPGIHRVEDAYTNWYLVERDEALTVIDTGVPTSWQSFLSALRELRRRPDEVDAVVLTHAHFDHV